MKLRMGKIGRNVLDRSVFKRIQGPRQTEDCVLLEDGIAVTADPITLRTSRIGELAVYAAIGDLSAAGAEPLSFSPVILLPPDTEESLLREIMDQIGGTDAASKVSIVSKTGSGVSDPTNYAEHIFYDRKREWNKIIDRAMAADFSWYTSAAKYQEMYDWLIG